MEIKKGGGGQTVHIHLNEEKDCIHEEIAVFSCLQSFSEAGALKGSVSVTKDSRVPTW